MATTVEVRMERLTAEAFAPYGQLIAAGERQADYARPLLDVWHLDYRADAPTRIQIMRYHEQPMLSVDVPRGGTDIGRALEVAMGAFGSEGQRRVVLLSDGQENAGNVRAASTAARALGVEVLSIPLERRGTRDEVRVQGVIAPSVVRSGEPFEVQVAIESRSGGRAHLVLLRDGTVLRDEDLSLVPGTNRYVLHEEAPDSGLREYEVIVNSDADRQPENNRHQTFVRVAGVPKVLYVRGGAPTPPSSSRKRSGRRGWRSRSSARAPCPRRCTSTSGMTS